MSEANVTGAATATLDISCKSCGATLSISETERTAECPYCASPSIIERPAAPDRPHPAFVVGFVLDQERAAAVVKRWIRGRGPFTHSGFKKAAPERTRGVYLPAYLYGGVARTDYSAEIGENYTTTETYVTTDSKGNTVTRTRTVVRTEHRDLSGEHACYVIDVIVTASRGIPNAELHAVEPFDLRALRRYDPALIAGWACEEPSLSQDRCLKMAHDESLDEIGTRLTHFMPGDSHRNLRYRTSMEDEFLELVLLPLWVFAVRYSEKKPPVRILVNGQTGEVAGRVPLSGLKILLTVLGGLGIAVAIILLLR